jgi:hypothetical protein
LASWYSNLIVKIKTLYFFKILILIKGKELCQVYVSLDYTICHVGIMHMVYLSYSRFRSIQSPKRYHNELIIAKADKTIAILWIISCLLWLPSTNIILHNNYTRNSCYFNYTPFYIISQDLIAYITPMLVIIIFSSFILKKIHDSHKRRLKNRCSNNAVVQSAASMILLNIGSAAANGGCGGNGSGVISTCIESKSERASSLAPESKRRMTKKLKKNSVITINITSPSIANELSNVNASDDGYDKEIDSVSLVHSNINHTSSNITLKSIKNAKQRLNIQATPLLKLYIIIGTFCVLWLPFCIIW